MALGLFGSGKKEQSSNASSTSPPASEKQTSSSAAMGKDGYYGDFAPDQAAAENGGAKSQPRKMSRIDAPVTKSITGEGQLDDDATDNSVAIGKQMEMEAGNAIKYRTCSWQKVS